MLGLCRMLLRQREEAEDAVQQTFLAAYRSLLSGVEPRHPAAWLATIARNECWGRIQQRTREPLPEGEAAGTFRDPVAAAAARADLAELWRAIGELPVQQREALLLREFSGLSYDELAEALAVSKPAVESLLFRARRGLRMRLRTAYGSAAGIAPLAAIREALARAIGGMPDPGTTGVLAKLASVPLAAKLVTGAAVVVVAGGTVAEVEKGPGVRKPAARAAQAQSRPVRAVPRAEPAAALVVQSSGTRLSRRRAVLPVHPVRSSSRHAVARPARTAPPRVVPPPAPDLQAKSPAPVQAPAPAVDMPPSHEVDDSSGSGEESVGVLSADGESVVEPGSENEGPGSGLESALSPSSGLGSGLESELSPSSGSESESSGSDTGSSEGENTGSGSTGSGKTAESSDSSGPSGESSSSGGSDGVSGDGGSSEQDSSGSGTSGSESAG